MRQFKLLNDPRFVDKLRDVVSMAIHPHTPSFFRSTKRARFRRWTARSPHCRGRRVAPEP
jgi:hypothetical protein